MDCFLDWMITLSFSLLLLWGPFHCTMAFPRSSRNISPLLKLFHDTSTCTWDDGALPDSWPLFKWALDIAPPIINVVNIGKYETPHSHSTPNTYLDSYDNKHAIICLRGSANTPCSLAVWSLWWFQWEVLAPSIPDGPLYSTLHTSVAVTCFLPLTRSNRRTL